MHSKSMRHRSPATMTVCVRKQGDAPDGLYIFCHGVVRLVMRSQLGDLLMDIPALECSLLEATRYAEPRNR